MAPIAPGATRMRRSSPADPLGGELLEPAAQPDRGLQPLGVHRALAVISVEAEEAEDAQIVFLDPRLGIADEAHPAGRKIGIAAKRIEHLAVPIGVKRIEREVATPRVLLPGGGEGDLGVAAEGLDVASERGHLEGHAIGDDGDRAVIDPGRHGLQPGLLGKRDHPLRRRGGGKIDLGDGEPEQRIAHGAADGARLDAVAASASNTALRSPPRQPFALLQAREPRNGALDHARSFRFVAVSRFFRA